MNEGLSPSCSFNLAYLFLSVITVQTTIPFPFPQNVFSEMECLIFSSEPWGAGLRTLNSIALWGLQSRLVPNNFWTKLGALRLIHCTSGCHLYNLWTLPQMQNSPTFNLGPVISPYLIQKLLFREFPPTHSFKLHWSYPQTWLYLQTYRVFPSYIRKWGNWDTPSSLVSSWGPYFPKTFACNPSYFGVHSVKLNSPSYSLLFLVTPIPGLEVGFIFSSPVLHNSRFI